MINSGSPIKTIGIPKQAPIPVNEIAIPAPIITAPTIIIT
jgi:hypothetical protein